MEQVTTGRRLPLWRLVGVGTVLLLLAALTLTLGHTGPTSAAPAAPPVPVSGLSPSGPAPTPRLARMGLYAEETTGAPRQAFSASTDNMLYVWMRWVQVAGVHDAYVTLTSPDGQIYQVLDVPFASVKAAAQSFTQKRPGVLLPVRVQIAQADGNGAVVWGEVPIAGTWMPRLPGAWNVAVTLDNDPTVLLTQPFTLTP